MRFKLVSALGAYFDSNCGQFLFLFSTVLRWDPWHTRLEFNYFLFAAPFAAAISRRLVQPLGDCGPRRLSAS